MNIYSGHDVDATSVRSTRAIPKAPTKNEVPYKIMLSLAPVIDVLGVLVIAALVYLVYSQPDAETFVFYTGAAVMYAFFVLIGFSARGLYDFETLRGPRTQAAKTVITSIAAFAGVLAFGYLLKVTEDFSRVWGATTVAATILFFIGHRYVAYHAIMRSAESGRIARRIVVVGSGEQARHFLDNLNADREPWLNVLGVFTDEQRDEQSSLNGYPILGDVDDLVQLARRQSIDEVVVTLPWSEADRVREIVDRLAELPVGISLGADLACYLYHHQRFAELGQVPVLKIHHKPLEGWGGVAKALEDRCLAALLILLLGPLMLLIAAAIRLESPGSAFFRQARYGYNNRVFEIYKFRTMFSNAGDLPSVPQATRDDPRVTRVGRVLRRTSLDELPQLFNVLQGCMSLVGPRPHAVEHNDEYGRLIHGYFARHRMKPGITGWAQVNGLRGETETLAKMVARVRYDLYYIENWSIWFDLRILLRTFVVGFVHPNAY